MEFFVNVWGVLTLLFTLNLFISAERMPAPETNENLRMLAIANNDMTLRLYQRLANGTLTNVFFSPLSLSICFGMLLQGTNGEAKRELSLALGYESVNMSREQVSTSFDLLLSKLLCTKNMECLDYNLKIINTVLVRQGLGLLPSYKRFVSKLYRAPIQEVNFRRDSQEIARNVNNWARLSTNGKINRLVEDIKPNTIITFLNAVYFKSAWKLPFSKEKTKHQKFYNDGLKVNARDVPFMHIKSKFRYATLFDVQVLELPYSGSRFTMIIILPNQLKGLSGIFDLFMKHNITSIRKHFISTNVKVSLPKFKISYSKDLSPEFQALGIQAIFNPKLADFSGMIVSKNGSVSQIMHKAAIEVNEEGSEAAAVSGINMLAVRMSIAELPTPEFIADHPFMFLIIERINDVILFMGCINKM